MHTPATVLASSNDAPRPRARWKVWLWLALSCSLAWLASRLNEPEGPARDWRHAPVAEPWPLPDFETLDQHERPLRRRDLVGRVWIAELLSLHCSSCRPLSDRFHKLGEQLDGEVRFLSFGLDLGDGASALRSHVRHHPRVDASRWTLAVAETDFSARLATGLGVARTRERYLSGLLELTPRLYLIDAHCRVVGAYDVDSAESLDRLADHARALSAARSSDSLRKAPWKKE